jgi:hypothetical protein
METSVPPVPQLADFDMHPVSPAAATLHSDQLLLLLCQREIACVSGHSVYRGWSCCCGVDGGPVFAVQARAP